MALSPGKGQVVGDTLCPYAEAFWSLHAVAKMSFNEALVPQ